MSGSEVKAVRKKLGITQRELENRLGKRAGFANYIEREGVKDPEIQEKIKNLPETGIDAAVSATVKHYQNADDPQPRTNSRIWRLSSGRYEITGTRESIVHFLKNDL